MNNITGRETPSLRIAHVPKSLSSAFEHPDKHTAVANFKSRFKKSA